ncbi:nucleoside diphosphate kinase [Paenibacillus baekrokdamisoli]|uniref:Nucleoside diphosphate kinase n=1 Tax=Paenibacillus baekrokdamisoli TaxID=1712516 RepID=A0A3G9J1X9_9BACL|nr:nucleoside-diphosphate kinase [Paenibacillus baekrokdamisoli]MBB3072183.1 nucleoside-diphosphate kinase [Paenibacillus baekrokdamisoli]BBH24766.1 nucleoside diphosphate kinase [Paenibacillus baekrokdamisoli]
MERTFVMIKPDGVKRQLIGPIITRFEQKGLLLTAIQLMTIEQSLAEQHYGELQSKPFFSELVHYLTSGPVCAMVWEGQHAVANARALIGKTNPVEAAPGTIRGDYALDIAGNIVHGSDSTENAQREINLFFHADRVDPMLFHMTGYEDSGNVNISH